MLKIDKRLSWWNCIVGRFVFERYLSDVLLSRPGSLIVSWVQLATEVKIAFRVYLKGLRLNLSGEVVPGWPERGTTLPCRAFCHTLRRATTETDIIVIMGFIITCAGKTDQPEPSEWGITMAQVVARPSSRE